VQTFDPEHPAIEAAARHDYERFAGRELEIRRAAGYPPFGSIARVVVRGPQEQQARLASEQLGDLIRTSAASLPPSDGFRLLGPGPAPIPRLRGEYRFHLQLQAEAPQTLRQQLMIATERFDPPRDIRLVVDIDPSDMQ
jgi:primosomal protein N' (replication factor Y)